MEVRENWDKRERALEGVTELDLDRDTLAWFAGLKKGPSEGEKTVATLPSMKELADKMPVRNSSMMGREPGVGIPPAARNDPMARPPDVGDPRGMFDALVRAASNDAQRMGMKVEVTTYSRADGTL